MFNKEERIRFVGSYLPDVNTSKIGTEILSYLEKIYEILEKNDIRDIRLDESIGKTYDLITKKLIWK